MSTATLELDRLLHQRRLRFGPPLEQAFLADYFATSLPANRVALITGILVLAAFGALDSFNPAALREQLWFIRFGLTIPFLGVLLALSFTRWYQPHFQLFSSLGMGAISLSVIGVQLLTDERDFGYSLFVTSLVTLLLANYTIVRLRFQYATALGWLVVLSYQPVALLHGLGQGGWLVFITSNCYLLAANAIGMLTAYFTEFYLRRDFLQEQLIEHERQRAESLLLNILPAPVAARLKQGEQIADSFEHAAVLFADIVGFTPLSTRYTPEQMVGLLNRAFSVFDQLAEKHGLEKIKTIGDAYMVVSGVPLARSDYLEALADMALEMQAAIVALNADPDLADIQIRIGLNLGPVVAGVIGLKKFSYDLWGDTVNTASRMESSGVSGRIQVTEAVYTALQPHYTFESRGKIQVKGKGEMPVYFLTGHA